MERKKKQQLRFKFIKSAEIPGKCNSLLTKLLGAELHEMGGENPPIQLDDLP